MHKIDRALIWNIMIPLTVGAVIYITGGGQTYLGQIIGVVPQISYPETIRNYACDVLWSYALMISTYICLSNRRVALGITVLFIILTESLQILERFPGTFDPMDIVVEIITAAVACLVTIYVSGGLKHEERKDH